MVCNNYKYLQLKPLTRFELVASSLKFMYSHPIELQGQGMKKTFEGESPSFCLVSSSQLRFILIYITIITYIFNFVNSFFKFFLFFSNLKCGYHYSAKLLFIRSRTDLNHILLLSLVLHFYKLKNPRLPFCQGYGGSQTLKNYYYQFRFSNIIPYFFNFVNSFFKIIYFFIWKSYTASTKHSINASNSY